ncbi:MAG: hypothetical protein BWY76_00640 [bacterium ADurb.Bin429]|nr:MAG: hypothetical protein BWY76_00640 [bacterium ADurb.Bin429]
MMNMPDADHGLLVRWSPVNDRSPTGDRLQLYRVAGAQRELLTETRGGYLPGQWYKLAVTSTLEGVTVSIDNRQRLVAKDVTPWRGGIGLYTEGETIFDDVTVYGRGVGRDLLDEQHTVQLSARYQQDEKGMAEWAASANDWMPHPAVPALRLHRWDYFGDHRLSLTLTPAGDGGLEVVLNSDGKDAASGIRALLTQQGKTLACTLRHGGRTLVAKTLPALEAKTAYGVRLRREGNRVALELDGETILAASAPATGLRPAYKIEGAFMVSDVAVVGTQVIDETFADAPTDWLAEGTWMPTTRWSCSPQWSFLGGWSRGDAVLWHKQRFTGDQSFEVYLAPKMEYPRERRTYEYHFRDLGVTLCGDGHDPRGGYAAVYGLDGARTVLLRNGVEVAAAAGLSPSHAAGGHTAWYGVALHKRGARIEVAVDRKVVLTYTDPKPLDGGVPAVWTTDNGIAVARARLHFANPPTPRTDPQVALDSPWQPEWADIGRPLTLAFPGAMATSGKPVRLTVTPRAAPAGEGAPTVDGATVTLTPKVAGEHWYRIQATDGETVSPSYHLSLPVFNPALGRDDSRAVVLYRFDEGGGGVIHDRAAAGPAADLRIPDDATAEWLPGRGLALRGVNHIRSAGKVEKLLALAERRAATFEFWISAATIFPPSDWHGYLLTWEKPGDPARNLAVAQISSKVMLIPGGVPFIPRGRFHQDTLQSGALFSGYRTGLQHIVFTWDGRLTRCYLNGARVGERATPWKPDAWSPDAVLTLGNQLNPQPRNFDQYIYYLQVAPYILKDQGTGEHAFLGAFYLAAVHDRCLSDADVARHYQAGPGAK